MAAPQAPIGGDLGGDRLGGGRGDPLGPLPPNWEQAYTDKASIVPNSVQYIHYIIPCG